MEAGDCLTLNMNAMENYLLSHSLKDKNVCFDIHRAPLINAQCQSMVINTSSEVNAKIAEIFAGFRSIISLNFQPF